MRTMIVLGLAFASVLSAEPLTQHDRDYAMSLLHSTRKQFLDSVAGLSQAQLNFKASPDRWSIMEVAEHIAISEKTLGGMVMNQIAKNTADPSKRAEDKIKDDLLIEKYVTDRSVKAQAPEMLKPLHKYGTIDELVSDFKTNRDANIEWVKTTDADLRHHFSKHPMMGELDAYQWLLLMASHSERHTLQILEVKADPKFPKE